MEKICHLLRREEGIVLVIALMLLSLLLGAGVGAIVSTQNDLKITANLKSGTQAFYLAEAGIEWGKQQIKSSALNPPHATAATHSLDPGNFSVSFHSPTQLSSITSTLTIRSTGNVAQSSHSIQALVTKSYELSDAAVVLHGNEGHAGFGGSSFVVDGRDHDPLTNAPVQDARVRPAISVSNATFREQVTTALSQDQRAQLVGSGGSPSVEQSDVIPMDAVSELANGVCNAPHVIVESVPPSGTLSVSTTATWGTRQVPELRCIDGIASAGDSLQIEGALNGVGLLVVRNADLIVPGALRWEGLIVVTGSNVSFRAEGREVKELLGALIVNETGLDSPSGTEEIKLDGFVRVRYSSAALKLAGQLLPLSAVDLLQRAFPSTVTQNYWRSENF